MALKKSQLYSSLCELMQRLNEIAGVAISPDSIDSRYPSFRLSMITGDDGALDQLSQMLAWFAETAA